MGSGISCATGDDGRDGGEGNFGERVAEDLGAKELRLILNFVIDEDTKTRTMLKERANHGGTLIARERKSRDIGCAGSGGRM